MRSAGNFSPEWGYLAPAPSFMRTARVVVVATAIGATAGAGVVLSLLDRPADGDRTSLGGARDRHQRAGRHRPDAPVTSVPVTAVVPASALRSTAPCRRGPQCSRERQLRHRRPRRRKLPP